MRLVEEIKAFLQTVATLKNSHLMTMNFQGSTYQQIQPMVPYFPPFPNEAFMQGQAPFYPPMQQHTIPFHQSPVPPLPIHQSGPSFVQNELRNGNRGNGKSKF